MQTTLGRSSFFKRRSTVHKIFPKFVYSLLFGKTPYGLLYFLKYIAFRKGAFNQNEWNMTTPRNGASAPARHGPKDEKMRPCASDSKENHLSNT
jgi:hypothetical protein